MRQVGPAVSSASRTPAAAIGDRERLTQMGAEEARSSTNSAPPSSLMSAAMLRARSP